MLALFAKILVAAGLVMGTSKLAPKAVMKLLAAGTEIGAGALDVIGYVFLLAYILGWKKGGERVGTFWPLSIVLEVVARGLWKA